MKSRANSPRTPASAYAARVSHAPTRSRAQDSQSQRIFLLSPVNLSGSRAEIILGDRASSALAQRLRREPIPLGEIFSFISGLYFRGKLAYAQAFAQARPGMPGAFIITASGGLIPPETPVTLEQLRQISAARVSISDASYRLPLERDARVLAEIVDASCEIILLGSIATPKYVEPLLGIFGERLLFPVAFVGRGDMSRGGLMLRCARAGTQLTYVSVSNAVLHGPRPPKLSKLPRLRALVAK